MTSIGRGEGRALHEVIEAAPRNEEPQIIVVPSTNLTVTAAAATEREIALVPARNIVELETIIQNMVADNSRDQYGIRAVGFVLWFYKNPPHRSMLLPELLEGLDEIMDADGNENLRSKIKVAIKRMNQHDTNSCPIKLENLTFDVFTGYVLSLRPKKKKKK